MTMPELSITREEKKPEKEMVKNRNQIVGSNWCSMFLYNIPSGSLMLTVPGVVVLICGAAMTGFIDRGQSWLDGLALIALICLAIGGVWTLGAFIYWFAFWCRDRPPMPTRIKRNSVTNGNECVNLEAIYTYPTIDDVTVSVRNENKEVSNDGTRSISRSGGNKDVSNYAVASIATSDVD